MMEKLRQEEEKLKKAENTIVVMTMLKEGTVPETVSTAGRYCLLCCEDKNRCCTLFIRRPQRFRASIIYH